MSAVNAAPSSAALRYIPAVRLALAWVLTAALLPYAWGRALILFLWIGRPERQFLLLGVVGLLAVAALTYRLAASFAPGRFTRWVGLGIPLTWAGVYLVLVLFMVGSLVPRLPVYVLMVLATLWIPWAAWMHAWALRPVLRWGLLVLLLALSAIFPAYLEVAGLTGDARVDFAWRWMTAPGNPDVAAAAGERIALLPGPDDYPQFLGPTRLGVASETPLARDGQVRPPRLLWRQPIGAGWGAFATAGGYAVTQEQRGPDECVVCYRIADGTPIWVHADPVAFPGGLGGPGPRATPTLADGRVYTVGATGLLNCLDGATGRPYWSVHILEDNHAENIAHGVCGSPLLVDDLVLVCPTGANGLSLAAYDRVTGRRIWRGGQHQASYGSPLLTELAGVRQVLLFNAAGVTSHDPASGQVLWHFPWTNVEGVNCSQPVPHAGRPDQVLVSTGYGKGAALFRVTREQGAWSLQPVWETRNLKTKFTTPLVHGDHAYGLDDGILACVDLVSGRRAWKEGRYQHGQVLRAGNLLLVQAEDGAVVLVEATPAGHRELGRIEALSGKTWNNPALAGRYLLVRNDREAACYEFPQGDDQGERGASAP